MTVEVANNLTEQTEINRSAAPLQVLSEAKNRSSAAIAVVTEENTSNIQVHRPRRPTRQKEREVFSNPTFKRDVVLRTQQAQRIAKRSLEYAAYSLFSLDVILPLIGDTDVIEEVDTVISATMKEVLADQDKAQKQLKAVMEATDIKELTSYSNPITFLIEVQSPQIAQFIRIIEKLDELIQHIDTLWINGEIKSVKRSAENQVWQKRISKLATKIVTIEKRARIAAHDKGKGEEVERIAPQHTTEMQPEEDDNTGEEA